MQSVTWSHEEELHRFLTAVLPHSARWQTELAPVAAWLEAYVLLKYHEEDLLRKI